MPLQVGQYHEKGGDDIPIADGGTGASIAATALSNIGGIDATAHDLLDHNNLLGVGDLNSVAGPIGTINHSTLSHTGIPGIGAGKLAQITQSQTSGVGTTTATIPADDTPPTSSEGAQFLTASITPTNAASQLLIRAKLLGHTSIAADIIAGLFKDSAVNSVAANHITTINGNFSLVVEFLTTAGSTSPQTWKLRAGTTSGTTLTVNGFSSARKYGTTAKSSIDIIEVLP